MEITELRIGSLMKEHYTGKIISVIELTQKSITFSDSFIGKWQAEALEISEEILLKVGFEKEISNDDEERLMYSIQISNNTSLYFDRHKDLVRSDIYIEWYLSHEWNNNHFKNELGWNNPKHLHQLQNLYFALTGEELNTTGLI